MLGIWYSSHVMETKRLYFMKYVDDVIINWDKINSIMGIVHPPVDVFHKFIHALYELIQIRQKRMNSMSKKFLRKIGKPQYLLILSLLQLYTQPRASHLLYLIDRNSSLPKHTFKSLVWISFFKLTNFLYNQVSDIYAMQEWMAGIPSTWWGLTKILKTSSALWSL